MCYWRYSNYIWPSTVRSPSTQQGGDLHCFPKMSTQNGIVKWVWMQTTWNTNFKLHYGYLSIKRYSAVTKSKSSSRYLQKKTPFVYILSLLTQVYTFTNYFPPTLGLFIPRKNLTWTLSSTIFEVFNLQSTNSWLPVVVWGFI